MGFFKKIKAGLTLLKTVKKIKKLRKAYMTEGMRTSEFWMAILVTLVTTFEAIKGNIDPELAIKIGAILTAVYTVARAFVKGKKAS